MTNRTCAAGCGDFCSPGGQHAFNCPNHDPAACRACRRIAGLPPIADSSDRCRHTEHALGDGGVRGRWFPKSDPTGRGVWEPCYQHEVVVFHGPTNDALTPAEGASPRSSRGIKDHYSTTGEKR